MTPSGNNQTTPPPVPNYILVICFVNLNTEEASPTVFSASSAKSSRAPNARRQASVETRVSTTQQTARLSMT